MNPYSEFLAKKSRWILSLTILVSFFGLFFPPFVYSADAVFGSTGGGADSALTGYGPDSTAVATCAAVNGVFPTGPCRTWSFFGMYFATGVCEAGQCVAMAVTPLGGLGMGVITTALNTAINTALRPNTTGSSLPSATSYNPNVCTGTRYVSRIPNDPNPCGIYIPTTTGGTPDINLNPGSGSTTTVVTTGPATATLSVTPTSGPAPLLVTFTVTDTSVACSHPAIMISAGDGSDPVVAIPSTTSCTGRTPRVFTGTYRTAGTYRATITSASTQQVLQTVTVTVSGAGSTSATSAATAFLSVTPTSGPAPLSVTFTVADTSTSCAHPAIMLSAGDGTDPVVAIPETTSCASRTPRTFTGIYRTAGTYRATITSASTQQVLQTVTISVSGSTATTTTTTTTTADGTNARLDAVPSSGPAPLSVRFTITDTSTTCPRSGVSLSVTSGTPAVTALPATSVCGNTPPISFDYTYRTAGAYRAEIVNTSTGRVLQAVTITVSAGSSNTAPLSVTTTTGSGTVDVSSSHLNLTNNTGSTAGTTASARAGTVQASTWGDIQAAASGVTITAGGHDTDGRTGIAGFYGYDAVPGVTPQALAQRMCNARPWTSSSATPVIPPSFFDSICTARGYKAGSAPPASSAGAGAGTSANSSSVAPKATTTTSKRQGPIEVMGPAKVYITAVPASVKVGSRTSIFWNAVGVRSCITTSPDGSFSGNTLSGAASTVPITGETIFSIVCLKPDGSQIANYVRVKLTI
ncbi:MAG: hypothetical protein AAB899_04205 [Patescibacteria group bacterium]